MKKEIKIAIVYRQHGDEKYTEEIAKKFTKIDSIKIFHGNPKASKLNVRFVESDMNRSFSNISTYEGKRAQLIKERIKSYDPTVVLDLHTTRAVTKPFVIITDLKRLKFVRQFGEKNVVLMTDRFAKGNSLIENIPNSIAIEMYDSHDSVKYCAEKIKNMLVAKSSIDKCNLFTVVNVVKEKPKFEVKNFKQLPNKKYPIFYGDKTSYKKNSGIQYLECVKEEVVFK